MSKDKIEAIRENTPTMIKKEVAKPCSCIQDTVRDIRCPDHGDPDKIVNNDKI